MYMWNLNPSAVKTGIIQADTINNTITGDALAPSVARSAAAVIRSAAASMLNLCIVDILVATKQL